jgi:hypothetical protein
MPKIRRRLTSIVLAKDCSKQEASQDGDLDPQRQGYDGDDGIVMYDGGCVWVWV